ncbi:MAG: SMP-30/gluconolactonase/LRE family protein [Chitinophagales bacterium]
MKKLLQILLLLITVFVLYFLFYPVDFEPVAYTPPPNPGLEGVFAKNNDLKDKAQLLKGIGHGPEDVAKGLDSLFYTGLANGDIVCFSEGGEHLETFVNTGGRSLGLKFDTLGNLIAADAVKGLLSISPDKKITVLTDSVDGKKLFFTDDLDIASDGVIWFTDASQRNHLDAIMREAWELQPTGRLLSYNPQTKETKIEMEGLRFANGVAIGPNDEFLLVNETMGMRIHKFWMKDEKKGQSEVLVNELPGYPDNITFNGKGTFWVALPSIRTNADFEALYDKPFMRKVIRRLPESIIPPPKIIHYGMLIGINESGEVIYNMQDPSGSIHDITSVNQYGDKLYLGSLEMNEVGVVKIGE